MQLLCDSIAVLGARHGLVFNPIKRNCGIIRFDEWNKLPEVHIRCGLRFDGKEFVFPLAPEGELFRFLDQRTTPCTVRWIGVHAESRLKVSLSFATPFKPRDEKFSAIPVLAIKVAVEHLSGSFRWTPTSLSPREVEIFFEVSGPEMSVSPHADDAMKIEFTSSASPQWSGVAESLKRPATKRAQVDCLVAPGATRTKNGFSTTVNFENPTALDLFWCGWSAPVLEVQTAVCPFLYSEQFAGIDAVADYARKNGESIWENARTVDAAILKPENSAALNHMLSYTLHSWLINTWLVRRPDGRLWFSVWEGNCYFHSTIDVEFTQSPFYLCVWPELLEIQLDFWPEYAKDGILVLGEAGADTRFVSHDVGGMCGANFQNYPHDMPVEETGNWLILTYAHWRRTGNDAVLKKHAGSVEKYLRFIEGSALDGDGIPVLGAPNTIDDGSPAIQFGTKQVYLAVKALASYVVGAAMLRYLGNETLAAHFDELAARTRACVQQDGWKDDHFVVTLEKSGMLKDPWSKVETHYEEVPGWDAPHIYTANTLPVLDMVGLDIGLEPGKLTTDLEVSTARCLREYGCVHTDFDYKVGNAQVKAGLAGSAAAPGWIAMNIMRDLAALYRGIDLGHLLDRYWEWQTTNNSREPMLFFETFCGNNLSFYPRGLVIYGIYDARAGRVVDRVASKFTERATAQMQVNFLEAFKSQAP